MSIECISKAVATVVNRSPMAGILARFSPQFVTPTNYEFEERAAILEFDGGLSRNDAEIFARRELKLMR